MHSESCQGEAYPPQVQVYRYPCLLHAFPINMYGPAYTSLSLSLQTPLTLESDAPCTHTLDWESPYACRPTVNHTTACTWNDTVSGLHYNLTSLAKPTKVSCTELNSLQRQIQDAFCHMMYSSFFLEKGKMGCLRCCCVVCYLITLLLSTSVHIHVHVA